MHTQNIIVTVVIEQDHKLLLVQEGRADIRGLWNIPSGHVEFGENIVVAATREAKEETGLDIQITSLLGIENTQPNDHEQNLKVILVADVMGGTMQADTKEILDVRWFPIAAIPSMTDKLRKPETMKQVLAWLQDGHIYPLTLIQDYL